MIVIANHDLPCSNNHESMVKTSILHLTLLSHAFI